MLILWLSGWAAVIIQKAEVQFRTVLRPRKLLSRQAWI